VRAKARTLLVLNYTKDFMDKQFVAWAKTIDWQTINDVCESLSDLNDSQYRFIKGRFIELMVDQFSGNVLTYVGDKHKDFDCAKFKCTVELKTVTSDTLYKTLQGKYVLRDTTSVIFNNSMGTNKKVLDPDNVADYTIVIKDGGVALTDKATVLRRAKLNGDGCTIGLKPEDLTELTGRLSHITEYKLNMKDKLDSLLRDTIANLDIFKVEAK
jgi:hypothetical protein